MHVAPGIVNAVKGAIGVRIRDLPMTTGIVYLALQNTMLNQLTLWPSLEGLSQSRPPTDVREFSREPEKINRIKREVRGASSRTAVHLHRDCKLDYLHIGSLGSRINSGLRAQSSMALPLSAVRFLIDVPIAWFFLFAA